MRVIIISGVCLQGSNFIMSIKKALIRIEFLMRAVVRALPSPPPPTTTFYLFFFTRIGREEKRREEKSTPHEKLYLGRHFLSRGINFI